LPDIHRVESDTNAREINQQTLQQESYTDDRLAAHEPQGTSLSQNEAQHAVAHDGTLTLSSTSFSSRSSSIHSWNEGRPQNADRQVSLLAQSDDMSRNLILRMSPESRRPNCTTSSVRSHWPLTNDYEALLLRHFVTKLSLWVGTTTPIVLSFVAYIPFKFDYCDPQNTFATLVVQRVVDSPTLLYAILATSARHLSVTCGEDGYQADVYHRECLALLIPALDDCTALLDETLCAATVILRLFEEISGIST